MPSHWSRERDLPTWRKASFCQSGECVEVAQRGDTNFMRSSKEPYGYAVHCTIKEWQSFVCEIKAGEFGAFRNQRIYSGWPYIDFITNCPSWGYYLGPGWGEVTEHA